MVKNIFTSIIVGWLIMITINREFEDSDGSGTYRIEVDKLLICKFEHNWLDGIVDCLQKATDAAELTDWAENAFMNDPKGG
jgi:hypothetical protein